MQLELENYAATSSETLTITLTGKQRSRKTSYIQLQIKYLLSANAVITGLTNIKTNPKTINTRRLCCTINRFSRCYSSNNKTQASATTDTFDSV